MKSDTSTTGKPERSDDTQEFEQQWEAIDWDKAETEVNRLQTRIAKAAANQDFNKVRRLQYLLTHSFHAKALAVRKVTTNKGRYTSGVDKRLWTSPAAKMKAVLSLTDKHYRAQPLRRVYIEKKGRKAKRPLGIPTMYDRAMQTLYASALLPVAETTADTLSFGFRVGRSAKDAGEQVFSVLARKVAPQWVLEGDIKGCFDNIDHEWLMNNIPMDKKVMGQFLKAGFIHRGELFPTRSGTPQGGAISSIYANMALDGMEKLIQDKYHRNAKGSFSGQSRSQNKVNLIRYADDFIITAATEETAIEVRELVREFLQNRGLSLAEDKTSITHINDGFDFLGWTFRKFNGKLITKPSQKSIKSIRARLSDIVLKEGIGFRQTELIARLNQVLKGWANYHSHVVSARIFAQIDYDLYLLLRKWARRRHRKKGNRWRQHRYWSRLGARQQRFGTDGHWLIILSSTPIVRHTKLTLKKNPYLDPEYFTARRKKNGIATAARNGEEMLEPYERETLTYGS